MITILKNILSNNNYKQVAFESPLNEAEVCLFCSSDSNKREEYFVTFQLHIQTDRAAQSVLEEKAQHLFDVISHSGKVERFFEKNCTLLLCHEEDKINRETILTLEEDQYNFKKNIITYTQQEIEELRGYLAKNEIEKITNSVINGIINAESGKIFLDFKNNHKQNKGHYSLILKTVLKLPFVTYNPHEQQLKNLLIEIESSLSQSQSIIYRQLIDPELEWDEANTQQQVERIWGGLV